MSKHVYNVSAISTILICSFFTSFETPAGFSCITPITIGTGYFINHVRLMFNIDGVNLGKGNSCCKVFSNLQLECRAFDEFLYVVAGHLLMKGRTAKLLGFFWGAAIKKNMQTNSSGVGMACVGGMENYPLYVRNNIGGIVVNSYSISDVIDFSTFSLRCIREFNCVPDVWKIDERFAEIAANFS